MNDDNNIDFASLKQEIINEQNTLLDACTEAFNGSDPNKTANRIHNNFLISQNKLKYLNKLLGKVDVNISKLQSQIELQLKQLDDLIYMLADLIKKLPDNSYYTSFMQLSLRPLISQTMNISSQILIIVNSF